MVHQKVISIPSALIISAQLLISPLDGGWGLVLATPLMIFIPNGRVIVKYKSVRIIILSAHTNFLYRY